MNESGDALRIVLRVIDPVGRTRLVRGTLPAPLKDGQVAGAIWPSSASRPVLVLDGVERPEITLRDRFAAAKE